MVSRFLYDHLEASRDSRRTRAREGSTEGLRALIFESCIVPWTWLDSINTMAHSTGVCSSVNYRSVFSQKPLLFLIVRRDSWTVVVAMYPWLQDKG